MLYRPIFIDKIINFFKTAIGQYYIMFSGFKYNSDVDKFLVI